MGGDDTMARKKSIFLSYHEKSLKSSLIVNQLEEFFKSWKISCHHIKWQETTSPPEPIIIEALKKSDYFIQIFTDKPGLSKWMITEWTTWNLLISGLSPKKFQINPIVFYTKDTNFDIKAFDEIRIHRDTGKLRVVQIDNSDEAEPTLLGILKETGSLPRRHGKICLPECCEKNDGPKGIQVHHLNRFLKNFYDASHKGLECVYPDRKAAWQSLIDRITILQKNEEVRFIGFTLKRYVHPSHQDGIGEKFESAIRHENVTAKFLILDRYCRAAVERSKIESKGEKHLNSLLFRDNKDVYDYWKKEKNVEIRFYRSPYAGMVLFNDLAFVELYHLGDDIADENMCGHVPILQIRGDNPFYLIFERHFNNIWKNSYKRVKKNPNLKY